MALSGTEWVFMALALLLGVSGLLVGVTSSSAVGGMMMGFAALFIAGLATRGRTRNS